MKRKGLLLLVALLVIPLSAQAYIGPGAGFAFLSSFLVLLLTFFLAVFSLLSWPFRLVLRMIRGQKAFKRSKINKLIIIGLDGLEPTLVDKYMSEGRLTNFSKLKKEGSYARLQTTTPAISPVAWSSFMTGSHPCKHNIFDFLTRDARNYLPDLSSAKIGKPKRTLSLGKYNIPLSKPEIRGLRKSVPFWKILGENGILSTVLRVPITFPPEKFKGHLLSGMCAPDLKGSQGTFFFYTSDKDRIKKREGGINIPVTVQDNRIETHISGPENTLLEENEEIKLPLSIILDKENNQAKVQISGQKFTLKKNTFSDWIRLTFRPGLGIKVRAIARFYISQIQPHFEMYLSPLNIDPEKPALPISHPYIYSVYLAKLLGSFITLGEANDTWALNEGVLSEKAFLEFSYANHEEWEKVLFNAMNKMKKGLVTCVFETTDSIQHMFWRYLDPQHPALEKAHAEMGKEVIEDLYEKMDDLVGRVRAMMDEKSALIIMSDHGFKSFRRGVNLNSWLYLNGYLCLKEGKEESGEWFEAVDWSRTKAYGVGLGGIFLNQEEREDKGIIPAGAQIQALKEDLIAKLNGLKDEEQDAVAINKIYDRDELPPGPYKENCPDLIVGYNEGYRVSWDSVTGIVNKTVFEDNPKAWSGDHCIDPRLVPGVFFCTERITRESPSIIDIAPTVLDLFGIPSPPHMDGKGLIDTNNLTYGKMKEKREQNDE